MTARTDWLRVVYGHGLEPEAAPATGGSEVRVRQVPAHLDLASAPRREQRVRLTILPEGGAGRWTLWLEDRTAAAEGVPRARVWWRLEPGGWQLLEGDRSCLLEGRGRTRLDVSLRLDRRPVMAPRLEFVAETFRPRAGERG